MFASLKFKALKAHFYPYQLIFKNPSGTSRGVLHVKDTYFLVLEDHGNTGIGECALFKGLSCDDVPDYEKQLQALTDAINRGETNLAEQFRSYPSIVFGYEQALLSLKTRQTFELLPSDFTKGQAAIPINGLVWMGDKRFMKQQIDDKLKAGFTTIKLKIGAIDFDQELDLLRYIRQQYSPDDINIRVDANGAFTPGEALEKLKRLSTYALHSIEQPIKAGQWETMAQLCAQTPLPIALDEELIGVNDLAQKKKLMAHIQPQFIILKPALHGGFSGSDEWIALAEQLNIDWWMTSALESNIGLNAIAQYTYAKNIISPQGLGTGGLFTNNFDSPLYVADGQLHYHADQDWHLTSILTQIQSKT